MSALDKFLAGWSFRGSTPEYAAGDAIEVMVTGEADGDHVARIGDSTLRISGAPADAVDTRVIVDVESWDAASDSGRGRYRETVGKSAF